jgi:UDP-GlcNAc:undecaprenyl-phosphate/decaprenyl-phosphate GlcNAc-1-phosphate transferase
VRVLPLVLSLAAGALLTPLALRAMAEQRHVRANWRGRPVPFPAGWIIVAAALVALVPLVLLQRLADADFALPGAVVAYALGVAVLGLVDDVLGSPPAGTEAVRAAPRGWRGHLAAVRAGRLSTGALKAVGALGLALLVLADRPGSDGEYLLAVALLVLTTNLFNLLDLRPGRSAKALLLLAAGVTLATWDTAGVEAVALFLGPALVLGWHDLRERAMLGDTGSNLLGALAGFLLVVSLGTTAQVVALVLVLAATVYGELRSITALVERTPGLRQLDSIGRPA